MDGAVVKNLLLKVSCAAAPVPPIPTCGSPRVRALGWWWRATCWRDCVFSLSFSLSLSLSLSLSFSLSLFHLIVTSEVLDGVRPLMWQ